MGLRGWSWHMREMLLFVTFFVFIVNQIYQRPTYVAMVTKIWEF